MQTWVYWSPNPASFTPQHTAHLEGTRCEGETARWALGSRVPGEAHVWLPDVLWERQAPSWGLPCPGNYSLTQLVTERLINSSHSSMTVSSQLEEKAARELLPQPCFWRGRLPWCCWWDRNRRRKKAGCGRKGMWACGHGMNGWLGKEIIPEKWFEKLEKSCDSKFKGQMAIWRKRDRKLGDKLGYPICRKSLCRERRAKDTSVAL